MSTRLLRRGACRARRHRGGARRLRCLLIAHLSDGSARSLAFRARYQRELAGFVDEAKSLARDPVGLVEGLAAERHAAMDRAAVLRHDRKRARDDAQQHYRELRDRHAAAQQVRELPPGQR